MSDRTFVIVGGGLAGAKAAATLRSDGFDGSVVLVGEEREPPYERPPLSKEYLRGEVGREKTWAEEDGFYEANAIEVLSGVRVEAIDTSASQVAVAGRDPIRYERLLLATGAEPRRLPIEGADLDGVHYLRTVDDSDALHELLAGGGVRLAIVGAGWIGSEVAASARQLGNDVTVLEMDEVPLGRVLGRQLGGFYRDVHADHGVTFLGGVAVERLDGPGRVERVMLGDGREVAADAVLIGIGVVPRTELAQAAGIELDDGVRVNAALESSVPNVYAAGDVANAWHPQLGRPLRVEHWANALNQGPAAARSMLGQAVSYDRVPYFFSDQYDVGMEYSGVGSPEDKVVIRGDLAAREFVAFWLRDGRVQAGMNVNVWDVTEPIQALVRSGAAIDARRLADTDESLEELAAEVSARA